MKEGGAALENMHSTFFGILPLKLLLVKANTLHAVSGSFTSGVTTKKFPPLVALIILDLQRAKKISFAQIQDTHHHQGIFLVLQDL